MRTVQTIQHNRGNTGFSVTFTNGEQYAVTNQDKNVDTIVTRIDVTPAEPVTEQSEIDNVISDVEQYYNEKRNKENI